MSVAVLTVLKLALLALLYLFLARVLATIRADVYGVQKARKAPPPRPAIADAQQPRRPRKAPRELVIHPPDGRPATLKLADEAITLGRADTATVMVDDAYVSDHHTAVLPDDEGWLVRDLGSTNGTYLNGAKVTQPTPLSAGDQIRIGKTRVEVRR